MTIPRVLEINAYQSANPPVHMMIAAYLGIGSKKSTATEVGPGGETLFDLMPRAK